MRILLVEDDDMIAEVIREGLEAAHYRVEAAADGDTGLKMAQEREYALLILDLMLPGRNGWSVCESLRRSRNPVPILMLTARNTLEDRVRGLEIGADDYLPKPFDFPELLARVRALLRRDKIHKTGIIVIGDLEVDTRVRRVVRAGQEIYLTPNEYLLLEALVTREGTTLSREFILEKVWMDDASYSNTVDVCIWQLRKKIDAGHEVKLIHTIHRMGYMVRRSDA